MTWLLPLVESSLPLEDSLLTFLDEGDRDGDFDTLLSDGAEDLFGDLDAFLSDVAEYLFGDFDAFLSDVAEDLFGDLDSFPIEDLDG